MQVALKPRPTTHSGGGCRLIPRRFWVQKQGVRVDYKEIKAAKSPMESPQARPDRNEGSKENPQ